MLSSFDSELNVDLIVSLRGFSMIFTGLASSFSSSPLPITTTVLCSLLLVSSFTSFTSLLCTMDTVAEEEREVGWSELDWINRTSSSSSPPKCTWSRGYER